MSKPVRARLIRGRSELLMGMDIVKKLDSAVNFGGDQVMVGQSDWEMMTFNAKHRWVFPLVRTDCAYNKLNEYFGNMRDANIEVPQVQGDFRRTFFRFGEFCDRINDECKVKWEVPKTAISGMMEAVRNTLFRDASTISVFSVGHRNAEHCAELENSSI